jgi:tetratricopeptide (TPR) repeat protein
MVEKNFRDVSQTLRTWFTKGNEALARQNYEYAITLFQQALTQEPGFFDCRKALRAAQFGKQGGGGTGFFRKMISGAGASPAVAKAQVQVHTNPAEALITLENALNGDPNSSAAHKLLAEAAMALDLPQTAVLSLEIVHRNSPGNKAVTLQLATALGAAGDTARAEKMLSELLRANPSDGEVNQALKNLSASRTLTETSYKDLAGGQGSYRDALKDKDEAVSLEQGNRMVKAENIADKLIGEYEARLRTEPNNLKLLRSIAELYTEQKRFSEALGFYQKIKESDAGNDASLDRAIMETRVRKFDHEIAQIDATDPEQADRLTALRGEKQAFQLAECQRRAEQYPTDLGIRFELGLLYFQNGRIGEAIQEFQKAQANPHKRIQALFYLGQCFAHRGINDLAARTFQNALKEKPVFDDEKKELLYALGGVLEKAGKKDEAIEQFKQIYEVDIGYKNVSAKIDAFYAGPQG